MVMVVIVVATSTLRAACNIIILIIVTVMHPTSDWGLEFKVEVSKFEPHLQKRDPKLLHSVTPNWGLLIKAF